MVNPGPRLSPAAIHRIAEDQMAVICGRRLKPLFRDDRQVIECTFDRETGYWHASFRMKCVGAAEAKRLRFAVFDATGKVEGVKVEAMP